MFRPVMYPACTLQSNAHVAPNSAGSPNRPAGIASRRSCITARVRLTRRAVGQPAGEAVAGTACATSVTCARVTLVGSRDLSNAIVGVDCTSTVVDASAGVNDYAEAGGDGGGADQLPPPPQAAIPATSAPGSARRAALVIFVMLFSIGGRSSYRR